MKFNQYSMWVMAVALVLQAALVCVLSEVLTLDEELIEKLHDHPFTATWNFDRENVIDGVNLEEATEEQLALEQETKIDLSVKLSPFANQTHLDSYIEGQISAVASGAVIFDCDYNPFKLWVNGSITIHEDIRDCLAIAIQGGMNDSFPVINFSIDNNHTITVEVDGGYAPLFTPLEVLIDEDGNEYEEPRGKLHDFVVELTPYDWSTDPIDVVRPVEPPPIYLTPSTAALSNSPTSLLQSLLLFMLLSTARLVV